MSRGTPAGETERAIVLIPDRADGDDTPILVRAKGPVFDEWARTFGNEDWSILWEDDSPWKERSLPYGLYLWQGMVTKVGSGELMPHDEFDDSDVEGEFTELASGADVLNFLVPLRVLDLFR